MDSAVAAALAKKRGRSLTALSFDYGQSHRRELSCARIQARDLGITRHVILRLPLKSIASGALLGKGRLNQKGLKPGKPASYVSFRNGVFLALAASMAEAEGALEIWGGWCGADYGGYPDCRAAFFKAMNSAIRLGSWAGQRGKSIRIVAPLKDKDKAATLRLGLKLGVDFARNWTCYAPRRKKICGRCDACRVRAAGFKKAKLNDRGIYA
jgi:7-cyano-7-deazaguanine synthase